MGDRADKLIVAITGASGSVYAQRLLDLLDQAGCQVHVVISQPGKQVITEELGIGEFTAEALIGRASGNLTFHRNSNLFSSIASGSCPMDAAVVCPCSAHTLSAIAAGLADTLLLRSVYVTLKERRPLILVPRESPLTAIDLENMLKIAHAGGIICPASPGFYAKPKSITDLVDFVVARILDLLHIEHPLPVCWKS